MNEITRVETCFNGNKVVIKTWFTDGQVETFIIGKGETFTMTKHAHAGNSWEFITEQG